MMSPRRQAQLMGRRKPALSMTRPNHLVGPGAGTVTSGGPSVSVAAAAAAAADNNSV